MTISPLPYSPAEMRMVGLVSTMIRRKGSVVFGVINAILSIIVHPRYPYSNTSGAALHDLSLAAAAVAHKDHVTVLARRTVHYEVHMKYDLSGRLPHDRPNPPVLGNPTNMSAILQSLTRVIGECSVVPSELRAYPACTDC